MDRGEIGDVLRSAGNCAVAEALLHWWPWNRMTGDELHPPVTYVAGLLPILGYVSAWSARRRRMCGWWFAVGLVLHVLAAGAAVLTAYVLDAVWANANVAALGGGGDGTGRRVH